MEDTACPHIPSSNARPSAPSSPGPTERRGRRLVDQHAGFTLHEADYGAGGVIAIRVHRTFSLASSLSFAIVERPAVGTVRVLDRAGDHAELVHLAPHRAAAEHWLSEHGYPNAVIEEVSADEAAADSVAGRVAA